MTSGAVDGASAVQLLVQTLQDPFPDQPATHVRDWLRFLASQFPLLAFQRHAYRNLHPSDLPTAYPLRVIINSILRDDGIKVDDPLSGLLDRRRHGLWSGTGGASVGGFARLVNSTASDLAFWEPDSEHTVGGVVSPCDVLGRELVSYIEDFRFASGKQERKSAKERLDGFLTTIEARLSKARPAEGPPSAALRALFQESRGLVELCWDVLDDFQISEGTRTILAAQNVPAARMPVWAARLALPVLSAREIRSLRREIRRAADAPPPLPTPRRFAVWLLAHRLAMRAPSLARGLLGSKEGPNFRGVPSPIDGVISH